MALNAELAAFLDLVDEGRDAGRPPMHEQTVGQARAEFERSSAELGWQVAGPVTVREQHFTARDGACVPVRLYLPADAPERQQPWPVLVYYHGGGFVVGSLDSHDRVCREFCWRTPCAVLAVGYRLAPEHPFPAAVNDAEDALTWLWEQAPALGLDRERLALAGDSAGATLATVAAIKAGQGALPVRPRLQMLFYPVTDTAARRVSTDLFDQGYLLETPTLEWFYSHYLPENEQRRDWRASPLRADVPTCTAPAYIAVAGFDPLLDEGCAYAEHLRAAGVEVTLHCQADLTHDFLRMASITPVALPLYETFTAVLAQALAS
ncbi:alpha/beta hydrolase domain-containing protein [Pseudomonas sp. M47T1]|uniref:alpha/beta hydrolase n=1 Tax=unclassified Pseudomonas TaxID=196821 RepID=UPI0002607B7D|nr:alpha/beta hydrolase [Pseudomonas sp. M47T1]EIK94330.1 alpha/beta hydrolase domain-containing protein [Pseudomonas sp. M47T1]